MMELEAECRSIGLENESSLHAELKRWYVITGDRLEVKVDGFYIDILRDKTLIEIQTRNFSAMKKKLLKLLVDHRVRIVHPIAQNKYISKFDAEGNKLISSRKSPKRGTKYDIFNELIRITDLVIIENLSIEILLINEEEIRIDNGKGSWRRGGVSIADRRLIEVKEKIKLHEVNDYREFIPESMDMPFSNKMLSKAAKIQLVQARKVTYCLKKMGIIKQTMKKGNELFFDIQRE